MRATPRALRAVSQQLLHISEAMVAAVDTSGGLLLLHRYYALLKATYTRKRDLLVESLRCAGLMPIVPQGTFFIMADTSSVRSPPLAGGRCCVVALPLLTA